MIRWLLKRSKSDVCLFGDLHMFLYCKWICNHFLQSHTQMLFIYNVNSRDISLIKAWSITVSLLKQTVKDVCSSSLGRLEESIFFSTRSLFVAPTSYIPWLSWLIILLGILVAIEGNIDNEKYWFDCEFEGIGIDLNETIKMNLTVQRSLYSSANSNGS